MKYLKSIFAIVAVLVACTPESPVIELEVSEISKDFEGGNVNVKVTANVPTETVIEYAGEAGDWIFLMPKVLKGNGVLSFSISKFTEYDSERRAVARVSGGGIQKTIDIVQTGREKPVATDLDLDIYNIYSDVEGGQYTINVATAGEWTATSDAPEWCTVENGTAVGVGSFVVKVTESGDYQYRTANVEVVSGTLVRNVFVQHVGTKIGDLVWANANVDDPDTFGKNCEVRGQLYQWNSKVGYPTYSANDHGDPDRVVPGFSTGQVDAHSETWTEENDPCPDGWRVPSWDELKILIGAEAESKKFWFDFNMEKGMSVAGAYVGLDSEVAKSDCSKGNLNGAIFIPQAGLINRDTGKQENWWGVNLWSATNVGQTWDMHGIWLDGNQNFGFTDWYGSMTGMSVRCVKK